MTRTRANILLLAAGAIWGGGFVAQSTAMDAIGPFLFIGLRFTIAALAMLPWALAERKRAAAPLGRPQWGGFVFIGLLFFSAMALQQLGILTTSVTNAGFLTALYVVLTPFLLVVMFRQMPHPVVWPAALLALAGIWLLSGSHLDGLVWGDWLIIFSALFSALHVIYMGRYAGGTGRPVTIAVVQFAVSAAIGLALAFAYERIDMTAIILASPEILYAGIFSGGVAFTLQAIGQAHTTPAQAAIFLSSEALFAALLGAVLLGERLPAIGLAGCALIFAAIILTEIIPALRMRAGRMEFRP